MENNRFARSRSQNFILILVLGVLNALTPFSIDMYLPAFPEIASDLGIPVAKMALTISIYFIGYAAGQLFYGPLLDRFGRKRPLLAGLALYTAATIGCMMTESLTGLLVFRLLSALGGCVASVGAVAMVRDFFPPESSAKVFSMLMLVLSVSPLLAPTAGSLVVTSFGWRVIFGILAAFAVIDILLVLLILPKGVEPDHSVQLRIKPIFLSFKSVLAIPQFAFYVLAGSFSFAGLFVYIAGSPAIFMEGFHVSAKEYGAIFAFLAAGLIGGGQFNLLLIKRYSEKTVFKTALMLQVLFSSLFLIATLTTQLGLIATIAFFFLVLVCAGITYPNAASLALAPFSKNIGSASALMGFLQLGIGSITSMGVGLLQLQGSLPTVAVICVSSVTGLIILLSGRSKLSPASARS